MAWASIHACGEIFYLCYQQGLQTIFQLSGRQGENLLYLLGLLTALLLVLHTLVVLLRKRDSIRRLFKSLHRLTAGPKP